jgi:hypothetical protein
MDRDAEHPITRQDAVSTGLDFAAVLVSIAPWIGGPIGAVLSGVSLGRKMKRVEEVLLGLAADLKDRQNAQSEEYLASEDFQDLMEKVILTVSEERVVEKRNMFRAFLAGAVLEPGEPYDEQLRFVELLRSVQLAHIRIIAACAEMPSPATGMIGSPSQTLAHRLPDYSPQLIAELVGQLNDLRLLRLTSLNTLMTGHGAADLRGVISPLGHRFLKYL